MQLQPGKEPFDEPASLIAPQPPAVLGLVPLEPVVAMRGNHLDAVALKLRVERVAVIRAIANQVLGLRFDHVELEAQLHERDLVVIRRDLHEKHPQVAASFYNALNEAKNIEYRKLRYRGTLRAMLPWMHAEIDDIDAVFGGDPWPYGIEPNRPTLEALVRYLAEQGVIAKAPRVDDLFVVRGA